MKLSENKDRLATMLKDTIITFCKSVVSFKFVLNVEGFIVLTCDEENVLVVKIDESHNGNFGSTGISNVSSHGPGTTSKLFAVSNTGKPANVRQPLSLQYTNWNTSISGHQALKTPKTRQKAPQPKKTPVFHPRGMNLGQRMSVARPRMGTVAAKTVPDGIRRGGIVRQRPSSSFSRNMMPCNPNQSTSMVPAACHRQRMPFQNAYRPPAPIQSRQLALQYFPSHAETSDAVALNLAICDVASNEVVETTSPAQFVDETREKMFRDVVSEALSKLDTDKPVDCPPPSESVPKPNPSDGLMASTSQTMALSLYSKPGHHAYNLQNNHLDSPSKQTSHDLPPVTNEVKQISNTSLSHYPKKHNVQSTVPDAAQTYLRKQIPCSVEAAASGSLGYMVHPKSAPQLQISLVPMPKLANFNSPPLSSSVPQMMKQYSNLMPASTQQWTKDVPYNSSIGPLSQHSDFSFARSSQMAGPSLPGVVHRSPQQLQHRPPAQSPEVNSSIVRGSNINSHEMPKIQQAFNLSNDLKKQLCNIFDQQQQSRPVGAQQTQSTLSPPCQQMKNSGFSKNTTFSISSSTIPFNLSSIPTQSPQSVRSLQTYSMNLSPYFIAGSSRTDSGQSIPHSNQMVDHAIHSPLAKRFSGQERNIFSQISTNQGYYQPQISSVPGSHVQYGSKVPIMQSFLSSNILNFTSMPNTAGSKQLLGNNLSAAYSARPTFQQQVVRLQAPMPSSDKVINNYQGTYAVQVTPIPSLFVAGAVVMPHHVSSGPYASRASTNFAVTAHLPVISTVHQQRLAIASGNLQVTMPCCSSISFPSVFSSVPSKSQHSATTERRLPPLRLKNLGHGNLMVIESSKDVVEPGGDRGDDDLEAIAMDQVLKAVEGLKEDSSRNHSFENPSFDLLSRKDSTTRKSQDSLLPDCSNVSQNAAFTSSSNVIDEQNFTTNSSNAFSQIIKDVNLSSADGVFGQNSLNDELISSNLTPDQNPPFGVFDVCRNEVVITRNGNVCESSLNDRLSDMTERTLVKGTDPSKMLHADQKDNISESSDTTEMPDMNSRVESGSDVVYDTSSFEQYTCQACQISMDTSTMLAEHYSTFHTNPEIHWKESEVRPYMNRIAWASSGGRSITLACPFKGCTRTFIGSKQVSCHYFKAHKTRMTPKQILLLKTQEGSLMRCEYCKLKFASKRLLNDHISKVH